MTDSTKLLTCAEFRILRDATRAERHKQVLPQLQRELKALEAIIEPLERKRQAASKHDKKAVEFELKPLWFQKQYLQGQIAMIESEWK